MHPCSHGGSQDAEANSSSDQDLRTSSEANTHGSKKRELRRQNWEQHRATIKHLYIDEGKRLNDIVEIMKRDYKFVANSRMYKHRLSQWGVTKYNRESDVQRILVEKKKREAEGKDSRIEINGRPVDFERIQKYLQRRKVSVDTFIEDNFEATSCIIEDPGTSQRGQDGPSITIRTPSPLPYLDSPLSPAPHMSPQSHVFPPTPSQSSAFQVAEEVLWDTRTCASEIADRDDCAKAAQPTPLGITFTDSIMMIYQLMKDHHPNLAGEYMQHASDQIKDLIQQSPLEALLCLFEAVLLLAKVAPEVVALILRYAADMAAVLENPDRYPIRHVLANMAGIAEGEDPNSTDALRKTAARAFRCHLSIWHRILGPSSPVMLYWYTRHFRVLGPDELTEEDFQIMEQILQGMVYAQQAPTNLPELSREKSGIILAGISWEPCSLLIRWEMANARSASTIHQLLQNMEANFDRFGVLTGATMSQALIQFTMAGSARDLKRSAEAAGHGRRAITMFTMLGLQDTAAKIHDWMEKWESGKGPAVGTHAYKTQLGAAAFGRSV